MLITRPDDPHLGPVPGPREEFPECLRGAVEQAARRLYRERVAAGLPGDSLQDWLDAEHEVLREYAASPARMLPGGDLFPISG